MPASLVYSKSVHKVFVALFVEYALCFVLCHNLSLHMPKTCGIGKTVLSVSRARFKSHFWKSRPFPTLRQRNICICPCLSRSTQISRLCPFSSRRQAEWTPVQASCFIHKQRVWPVGVSGTNLFQGGAVDVLVCKSRWKNGLTENVLHTYYIRNEGCLQWSGKVSKTQKEFKFQNLHSITNLLTFVNHKIMTFVTRLTTIIL